MIWFYYFSTGFFSKEQQTQTHKGHTTTTIKDVEQLELKKEQHLTE